jgi:prepilin-type N-terminal cleavage/methylation domain-containing protein
MKKRGFTLVEVLLVIIIVGILAAIVIPRVTQTAKDARYKACAADMSAINAQLELWNLNKGSYPSLASIFADPSYFPDGVVSCPVLSGDTPAHSSSYTLDTTTNRVKKDQHLPLP